MTGGGKLPPNIRKDKDIMGPASTDPHRVAEILMPQNIQAQIGRRLLAAYDEVLRQPVPDRFRRLLDELEEKQLAAQSGAEAKGARK